MSAKGERQYWLFKSEPDEYSIDDLVRDQTTFWFGVRNYQARNFLRDTVKVGDRVLFYHSSAEPTAVVGTCRVIDAGTPDATQFDPKNPYYDAKSTRENPRWFGVRVQLIQKFAAPITRDHLREHEGTAGMMVLKKGARLSIQPVTEAEWLAVHSLAGVKPG